MTAGALVRIAFFLAIAFFLFMLWRERRSDIEAWSELSRRIFYAAMIVAVVDIGSRDRARAVGADAIVFFAVLAAAPGRYSACGGASTGTAGGFKKTNLAPGPPANKPPSPPPQNEPSLRPFSH